MNYSKRHFFLLNLKKLAIHVGQIDKWFLLN